MGNQSTVIQRTGIHAIMDILQNMPLPDSLKDWKVTILLFIHGKVDYYYEWIIRDGQWRITEGKTQVPDLILSGKESDFIIEFTDIRSAGKSYVLMAPQRHNQTLPFDKCLKYGTLRGTILKNYKDSWPPLSAEGEGLRAGWVAARQQALVAETLAPVFKKEEIIPPSDVVERTCNNCGRGYLGAPRSRSDPMPLPFDNIYVLAVRCQNCGFELCGTCRDKVLKIGVWDGWKKTKCPECNELFGPGQVILMARESASDASGSATGSEPMINTQRFLTLERVSLDPGSGVVIHQPGYQASILDGITASLLNDRYIGNAATFGMGGNKYANDLKKLIDRDAQKIGEAYFADLVEHGAILNVNELPVGIQGLANVQAVGLPINIGHLIVLFAQDIANLQRQPVTLETMKLAYQFFLADFQRYLVGFGVQFQAAEELVDWKIIGRSDKKENSVFLLATDRRVIKTQGKEIIVEMQLLEAENRPLAIFQQESTFNAGISALMLVLRTNRRLIWYTKNTLFKSDTVAFGDMDQAEVLKNTGYFEKSKLFLLLTDRNLLVWPEEKPLQTIPLAAITRIETAVESVEKKTLFISHKAEQNKIVLYCPAKVMIDVAAKEQAEILELLKRNLALRW